jgi:murein L,D-transpeptidase YafK
MTLGGIPRLARALLLGAALAALAACTESTIPKDIRPVSAKLVGEMAANGMTETSPIFVRIFKEESALEVWKQRADGKYALLKTYEICRWSGVLGPKIKEGDRQAPEGFYTVTPGQMNPNSSYYLSFNIGFPNAYDRAHGRTGSHLMVHGACSSAGCYSMTDEAAGEIFALARDAFKGGQREFQIQAFPFRMTPENIARHRGDPNMDFWMNLKEGYDHFEVTRQVPKVDVCGKRYVFNAETNGAAFNAATACPAYTVPEPIATAVAAKQAADGIKVAEAVAKLEASAAALAAQQDKLASQRAAEEAAAAADAARPPLLSRVFKGRKGDPQSGEPPGEPAVAGAAPIATPKAKPAATAANSPPAAASPAPVTASAAAEPIPESVDATETTATAIPESGPTRRLSSDFDWPEDDSAVIAGGGKFLPSGLDIPPPTAN